MPDSSDDIKYWGEIVAIMKSTNFVSDKGIAILGFRETPASTTIRLLQPTEGDQHILDFKNILTNTLQEKGMDSGIEVLLGHMEDSNKVIRKDYSEFGGVKPVVIYYSSDKIFCG